MKEYLIATALFTAIMIIIMLPITRWWHNLKKREQQLDFIADLLRMQLEAQGQEVPLLDDEKKFLENSKNDNIVLSEKNQMKSKNYIPPQIRKLV